MIEPKKSLGQNFLIDKNIARKILKLTKISNQNILEIGPGTGSLTNEIIKLKPNKLILIEKDDKLIKDLQAKYNKFNFVFIINKDILKFDFYKLNIKSIISNLPYNISIKLILKILTSNHLFNDLIFMVQKEVANKMNYKKNIKNNKLRFFIEATTIFKMNFDVPKHVFFPKPKVISTVITLKPIKKLKINKKELFFFANKIFSKKRKKISNILEKHKYNDKYSKSLLDKRSEDLSTSELLYLFNKF